MVRSVYMGIRHLDSTTGELYELPQLLKRCVLRLRQLQLPRPQDGELEYLESCLVRREAAEICDFFTLSYSTRQAALNGDAASYGTRGAPRTRFSHPPTP